MSEIKADVYMGDKLLKLFDEYEPRDVFRGLTFFSISMAVSCGGEKEQHMKFVSDVWDQFAEEKAERDKMYGKD